MYYNLWSAEQVSEILYKLIYNLINPPLSDISGDKAYDVQAHWTVQLENIYQF